MSAPENDSIPDADGPVRSVQLARIRDNQRRSRARRKEYVQELEQKFRVCEQSGVAASAQVQAAARKVLDENRRLRQLLHQYGMDDAGIDHSVRDEREPVTDTLSHPSTSPVEQLHVMLQRRLPCASRTGCGAGAQQASGAAYTDGTSRSLSTTPIASSNAFLSHQPSPVEPSADMAEHWRMSNHSMDMGTGRANSPNDGRYDSNITPHDMPFQGEPNGLTSWTWPPDSLQHSYDAHLQAEPHDYIVSRDASSCLVAAQTIRSIQPGLGRELEQELGCMEEGSECHVPNTHIFTLMDHYSTQNR